jgi:chromosome segregation ATPase
MESNRRLTPEEQELEKKSAELLTLESELAQRELDLATLRAELVAFEARYLSKVGVLYAELDEIEAQIAEVQARLSPKDDRVQQKAAQARAQAQQSAQTARAVQKLGEQKEFAASENLKKLYREVAKRVHPDLATDEQDRARRQRLMTEANQAYEEGDEAKLQAILDEWESSPESVKGEGVGADLIRTIRKIAQIDKRLSIIENEMAQLMASDLYQLKAKVEEAENEGRDLLADMATQIEGQIAQARNRLSAVAV